MRIHLLTVCSPVLIAVFGSAAVAQEVPRVTPGARVRVWAPQLRDQKQAGTLMEVRGDTLVLQAELESDTLRIPRASVARLDVSRGRKSRIGAGIRYGALGGVATGALAGLIVCRTQSNCANSSAGDLTGFATVAWAAVGLVGGVIIGGIIGASNSGEQWQQVPPSGWRVGLAPLGDGRFAVAASVRF